MYRIDAMSRVRVSHSTPATASILEIIRTRYELAEPLACRLQRAYTNDVFRIDDASGAFYLKVARHGWRDAESVGWELRLIRHLAASGIPVSEPIASRGGEDLVLLDCPEGTRAGHLSTALPGQRSRPPHPVGVYHQQGQLAAHMHEEMDAFSSVCPRPDRTPDWLVSRSIAIVRDRVSNTPGWLEAYGELLVGHLECLSPAMDWGVCHGDLTLDNVVLNSNGEMSVFDFDLAANGFRAAELAAIHQWSREDPVAIPYLQAWLQGYREVRPFTREEELALPLLAGANMIWDLAHQLEYWERWGGLWMTSDEHFQNEFQRLGVLAKGAGVQIG